MKSTVLAIITTLFLPVMLYAGLFSNGPNVDYNGKPVIIGGQNLFKRFAEASPFYNFEKGKPKIKSWNWFCFEFNSRELIDWEIEKALKIKLYKLSIFFRDAPKLKTDEINFLMALNPKRPENVLNVVRLSAQKPEDTKKFSSVSSGVDALALRQEFCDLRVKHFRKTKGRLADNIEESWLPYWDRLYILNKLLDEKAVNDKNLSTYGIMVFDSGMIPDCLARKIIAYFKLDSTSSAPLTYSVGYFLGANPLLTKAVMTAFSRIKPVKHKDIYSGMAMYVKNDPNLRRDIPANSLQVRPSLNPKLIYSYANACGDYNKGWKFYLEIKRQMLTSYEISQEFIAGKCDENTFSLLCGYSNLDFKIASRILDVKFKPSKYWRIKLNPKFAKLVDGHNKTSFYVAPFFPFESLTPQMQKKLFIYYLKKVEEKGRKNCEYFENLLLIKSQKYRDKLVRQLLKQHVYGHVNNTQCSYALQRLAPFTLPELVKIAGEKDSRMARRACELIGTMSLYGKPAAKGLEQVLQNTKRFTIKIAVILALARIGSRESIPVIETYIGAKNKLLDRAARQAVRLLKPVTAEESAAKE